MPENLCFSLPSEPKRFRIFGGGTGRLETNESHTLPKILWAAKIIFPFRKLQNAFLQWYIPIEEEQLLSLFKNALSVKETLVWDAKGSSMTAVQERYFYDKVTLDSEKKSVHFDEKYISHLASMILHKEIVLEKWDNKVVPWLLRYKLFKKNFPEMNLLEFNQDDLQIIVEEALSKMKGWKDLERLDWLTYFKAALSWNDLDLMEKNFPESFMLTKGRRVQIQYSEEQPPKISSKLQDFYDQSPHPAIGTGRVRLVCEILAPNHRPVQTTEDILGFWESSYPQIKKDLYRRYPRHEWR
jgi:ATP-dependent helicase HrpB